MKSVFAIILAMVITASVNSTTLYSYEDSRVMTVSSPDVEMYNGGLVVRLPSDETTTVSVNYQGAETTTIILYNYSDDRAIHITDVQQGETVHFRIDYAATYVVELVARGYSFSFSVLPPYDVDVRSAKNAIQNVINELDELSWNGSIDYDLPRLSGILATVQFMIETGINSCPEVCPQRLIVPFIIAVENQAAHGKITQATKHALTGLAMKVFQLLI